MIILDTDFDIVKANKKAVKAVSVFYKKNSLRKEILNG